MVVALAVGVCGAIGALSRYGLDAAIERRTESVFPWATFVINVSGCLAVGFVIAALVDRHRTPQWLRGERRILLGAVAYAIPYVAIWSIAGFALGATVRAV